MVVSLRDYKATWLPLKQDKLPVPRFELDSLRGLFCHFSCHPCHIHSPVYVAMEESAKNLELVDQAIKLLAEKRNKETSCDDDLLPDDSDQLLSKLLSELGSLKGDDAKLVQSELSSATKDVNSPPIGEAVSEHGEEGPAYGGSRGNAAAEEIVKELRAVRRQNFVTRCLLSVMIALTVAWQVSEVSLILKVKDGLRHPFKSFGSMLTGMVKSPRVDDQDTEKQQSEDQRSSS